MTQKKLFNILSLVCNLFIFVSVTWSVLYYFYHEDGSGNMLAHGFNCFRFFTIDSNTICGITSAIYLYFNIQRLRGKDIATPFWLKIAKYITTVSVGVTFFVVLLVLAPMFSITEGGPIWFLYEQNCFILHFMGPVMAMLTVALFEKDDIIENKKLTYWSFATVGVYATVYLICVVFAKVWDDFYGMTFGGRLYLAPFGALLIFGICWGTIELLYFLQRLSIKKLPDKTYGKGKDEVNN